MEQRHSGSGDNVAGNKTTVTNISVPRIIGFTLLGVSLFVVGYLLWPDPVYLSGFVYSSGGQPEEGVSLEMRTRDGDLYQSVTDAQGKFLFDRLSLRKAEGGELLVRKDIRERRLTLDSLEASENGLQLKLPPGTPPFRITYYNLGAHAIDKLLHGELEKKLGGALAEDTYVLPNAVTDYYKDLLKTYGQDLGEASFLSVVDNERPSGRPLHTVLESYDYDRPDERLKYLPGKGNTSSANLDMYALLNRDQTLELLNEEGPWLERFNIRNLNSEAIWNHPQAAKSSLVAMRWLDKRSWTGATQLLLEGRERWFRELVAESDWFSTEPGMREREIQRFRSNFVERPKRHVAFWNAVLGDTLPDQLMHASLHYVSCGADDESYDLSIALPELFMQIAVLENISEAPIRLDTFVYKQLSERKLQGEPVVQADLEKAELRKGHLFPQEQLAPGEKLAIPQYFYAQASQWAFMDPEDARYVGIRDPRFIQDPKRKKKAYTFGPVFQVRSVLLGPELYAVRIFDRDKLVIRDGAEVGSCPYAYTRGHGGASWILQGHLMYGRNRASRAGVDTLLLEPFDGQLLIREKDPETSYLQYAYLAVERADGHWEHVEPSQLALRSDHPGYFTMEQGDSIPLYFPGFRAQAGDVYHLIHAGYYLPYEPDYDYRLQRMAQRILGRVGAGD